MLPGMVFAATFPFRRKSIARLWATIAAAMLLGAAPIAAAQEPGVRAQGEDVLPTDPAAERRSAQRIDPRTEMRRLIRDSSRYLRSLNPSFIVIVEGGLDLLETEDLVDPTAMVPATSYIRALDGILVQGIKFPLKLVGDTEAARKRETERIERLADLARANDLKVLVTDFVSSAEETRLAVQFNRSKGFVTFAAAKNGRFRSVPKYPPRPFGENHHNITGIGDVQNFLHITDSSEHDTHEDFVLHLAASNFDAVIVDVFHRGRTPFARRHVDSMKYKKLGARRLVLAYMDIGHATNHAYYWKPEWREGNPYWIAAPVAGEPHRHFVEYWQPGWRSVVTGNTNSYLYGIAAQGFDGVVIGGVDAYRFFEGTVQ